MLPLPSGGLPTASLPVDGNLKLFAIVALLVLLAGYGLVLWAIRFGRTRTVHCPDKQRTARVEFRFDHNGSPVDVERCSLQRVRLDCSMRCLRAA